MIAPTHKRAWPRIWQTYRAGQATFLSPAKLLAYPRWSFPGSTRPAAAGPASAFLPALVGQKTDARGGAGRLTSNAASEENDPPHSTRCVVPVRRGRNLDAAYQVVMRRRAGRSTARWPQANRPRPVTVRAVPLLNRSATRKDKTNATFPVFPPLRAATVAS